MNVDVTEFRVYHVWIKKRHTSHPIPSSLADDQLFANIARTDRRMAGRSWELELIFLEHACRGVLEGKGVCKSMVQAHHL